MLRKMYKLILLILVLAALSGCQIPPTTRCYDGIEYWRTVHGIAVRIDPATLLPRRCAVEEEKP